MRWPSATRSTRSCTRPPLSEPGEGSLFALEEVTASRGDRPVLRGASVEIPPGTTALVGPSGAGKSTLLRLLNRLADPDGGVVRFHGDDLRTLDVLELRRRVTLVAQLPAPFPGSVADNVAFGPALAGRRADVAGALEQAGLDGAYAERETERLSVGEQQRVMLARALALEPEVLLLDEPTAALDDAARAGVEATLGRLGADRGLSILLVTHEREQAARLASRTLALVDGRIEPA